MGNICIISNNPLALAKYAACAISVAGDVAAVFCDARNRIHHGATLINHPLSGSIKPNQSPYKSLVLSANESKLVDFVSLAHIEEALATLAKLPALKQDYSATVHEDFMVIDLDLLDEAMKKAIII